MIRENLVHSIDVVWNHIRGGVNGIISIGGISLFTSDSVIGNSVSSAKEFGNFVRNSEFRCTAIDDVLLGDEGGAATDNRADFECSEGRSRRRGGS